MKIPIIKKGEYDIWSMRMRQYICHTDQKSEDINVNGDLEDEATTFSTASGDFGVSTAGGINQVPSTPSAHDIAHSFLAQPTTSPQLEMMIYIDRMEMTKRNLESVDVLYEYAFRNKIIESKTTETNKTVGTTNEASIVKPKSVNENQLSSKSKNNRDEIIIEDWTSDDER
ncbi:hypothetical protein Tco_1530411 [Tanacetum coccineum]